MEGLNRLYLMSELIFFVRFICTYHAEGHVILKTYISSSDLDKTLALRPILSASIRKSEY